jgi:signal transduction histidine kinase
MLPLHEESIRSALENVLRNAAKHTPPGSEVTVLLYGIASGGARVVIEDQGPGVAAVDLSRIFQPFYRAPPHDAGGSGLGLAIARRAVELNGGSIVAANRPAGGLRITIELPAGAARDIRP